MYSVTSDYLSKTYLRELIAVCLLVFSANSKAEFGSEYFISCDRAPAAAVINLPEPFQKYAKVYCTKYGHIIGPSPGMIWVNPTVFSSPLINAEMQRYRTIIYHASYFTSFEYRKLEGELAKTKYGELEKVIFQKIDSEIDDPVMELKATNNKGFVQKIYIFPTSDLWGNVWGYLCQPECDQNAFLFTVRNIVNDYWNYTRDKNYGN